MGFNIGEKVTTYEGRVGTVVDKMYSELMEGYYYELDSEGYVLYKEDELSLFVEKLEYAYEIEHVEKLVVARLYKIVNGEKTEIAKGHGHIFHDGVYGVAQAASYALKRICDDLNGGSLRSYRKDLTMGGGNDD